MQVHALRQAPGYAARMLLGIDHLVIAVADPDHVSLQLEREPGLTSATGGRHDELGTFNRLVWLGDSYLELIGVFERRLAERSWLGVPTLRMLERGGGLATWAIATDALAADLAALHAAGSDLGEPIDGERRRADGAVIRWRLATSSRLGPSEPPFLIEHDSSAAEWTPAERATRAAQPHPLGTVHLEALELVVDDVNQAIQRFRRTVGLLFRPSLAGGGSRDAEVGSQFVRLRPRRSGSGSAVIHVAAPVPAEQIVELLGCRWVVSPTR